MRQKPIHLFWAIAYLLVGAFLAFAIARNLYATVRTLIACGWRVVTPEWTWLVASFFPVSFLATYFVWAAKNRFQRAAGRQVNKTRIGWGRLVSGFFIIFFAAYSHFVPGPRALRANNADEAAGMIMMSIFLAGIGIGLMCWAFVGMKSKRAMSAETLVR